MKKHSFVLCCLMMLAACSGSSVTETLGLNREAPDEFVVVSRPPLSVPPDFNLLPPEEGKAGPAATTSELARTSLLGVQPLSDGDSKPSDALTSDFVIDGQAPDTVNAATISSVSASSLGSAADSMFLKKTGADNADASIRKKLSADKYAVNPKKKEAKSLYEQIMADEKSEPVVDAKKEAARIRSNKEKGKAVNDGEVKTIDAKPKSVLDRIF